MRARGIGGLLELIRRHLRIDPSAVARAVDEEPARFGERDHWYVHQIFSTDGWDTGEGDPRVLATGAFTKTPGEPLSVYRARSEREETEIMSALQLGRANVSARGVFLLRFTAEEIAAAGLTIDKNDGETGIPAVNVLHHDLLGTEQQYVALAKSVLDQQAAGYDRFRRLIPSRLIVHLEGFLGLPELVPATRRKIEALIERIRKIKK